MHKCLFFHHATHARNVRVFLVDMVTNGSSDDIPKPTYPDLQNPRFSAKTYIRNLSFNIFASQKWWTEKIFDEEYKS